MFAWIPLMAGIAWAGSPRDPAAPLDCAVDPCAEVLPAAASFEPVEGKPYVRGVDGAGETVGWVGLSTDLVQIKAYSGKPLVTVVGLGTDGTITGARVVHHSEPILLVGIPESKLHGFVAQYAGVHADEQVRIGGGGEGRHFDVVSGATVTILAQNQTILDTARAMGADVGVVKATAAVPGHFVEDAPWTWNRIVHEGALGHLTISQAEMGGHGDQAFLDLWFGVADAPQVGIPLLGERTYAWAMSQRGEGDHLLVMLNDGTWSFRGSGFVRGGIFDRFHLEQGLSTITFRDMDYQRIPSPEGAPEFPEAGLFFARGRLDPGRPFDLVFLGSVYDGKGGFSRDFKDFRATTRVPRSVYALDGPDPEQAIWRGAWAASPAKTAVVVAYLAMLVGLFAGRRWMAGRMQRLRRLHTTVLATSFFGLGLWLHLQPSVTQLLTFIGSVVGEWRWGLFLSDPLLFVTWIFIAVVGVLWGRGVFCGWACPYGALNELIYKVARKLHVPELELPDRWHFRLRYLRYAVLALLVAVFLWSPEHGERLAEVEPFKSTFFVAPWTRHPGLFAWWLVLLGWAATTYRPFCRYVCPLGAGLAIPSSFRLSGPYRRDFCSKCKICTRGCEPRAIRDDGTIDPRECLNCWECEANFNDDQVCPPLVRARRDRERSERWVSV